MPKTEAAPAVTVHVAGPVEREKVGSKRVRRQRCLRCDGLMRDEREQLEFWLLGDRVGIASDGWTSVIDRVKLRASESACEPIPFVNL